MKANPETVFSLAGRTATKIASLDPEQDFVQGIIADTDHPYWKAIESVFAKKADIEVAQEISSAPVPQLPLPHIEILKETPKPCVKRSADEQVAGMEMMYKMLDWSWTTSGLVVPNRQKGFDRLVAMADTSLTNNRGFAGCKSSFSSWRYSDNLDVAIPAEKDERHPKNGIYAVWFRDRVEADEELKNKSAEDIAGMEPKIKTITTLERMVFELVYYMETGKHLDIQNVTLCSGSRDSDGNVPGAYGGGSKFRVSWYFRGDRPPDLRSREAVSL